MQCAWGEFRGVGQVGPREGVTCRGRLSWGLVSRFSGQCSLPSPVSSGLTGCPCPVPHPQTNSHPL